MDKAESQKIKCIFSELMEEHIEKKLWRESSLFISELLC